MKICKLPESPPLCRKETSNKLLSYPAHSPAVPLWATSDTLETITGSTDDSFLEGCISDISLTKSIQQKFLFFKSLAEMLDWYALI